MHRTQSAIEFQKNGAGSDGRCITLTFGSLSQVGTKSSEQDRNVRSSTWAGAARPGQQ
jgi:hypothetical protein